MTDTQWFIQISGDEVGHLPVRLVGVGVSGLDDTGVVQGMLFDGEEREKQGRVDAVADEIKERFGTDALRRGSSLRGESPTAL
jgi:DNA polymerase IV